MGVICGTGACATFEHKRTFRIQEHRRSEAKGMASFCLLAYRSGQLKDVAGPEAEPLIDA